MALSVNVRHTGDVTLVDLRGRITLGESTGLLRDNLKRLFGEGAKKIVLNLAEISYVDSVGLGEIVGFYTTALNQGASVKLLNMQKKLMDLMQVTKLHTVFESFDDEQRAVDSFAQAAVA